MDQVGYSGDGAIVQHCFLDKWILSAICRISRRKVESDKTVSDTNQDVTRVWLM
jgi:hypothetical protein